MRRIVILLAVVIHRKAGTDFRILHEFNSVISKYRDLLHQGPIGCGWDIVSGRALKKG